MGTQPLPKKGRSPPPQFSGHVYCGQTAAWIKLPLGTEVDLGLGDTVLDGYPAPPFPKEPQPPIFRPTSVEAKPLDGLRCQLVWRYASAQATLFSMGTQLPGVKRAHPPHPIFGPCLWWPNGCMDHGATWYGGKRRPRRRCVTWGCSSPYKRGTVPSFRFMSIVAKRLDG